MSNIAASLPLPYAVSDDAPWTLWCRRSPLTLLASSENTDRRSVLHDNSPEPPVSSYIQPQQYVPQTNRYHAVLSKLNQKAQRVGAFSSWQN